MMVRVNVEEFDTEPAVAVTVTVEVEAAGVDEPQPLSMLMPATLTASSRSICSRPRRFFQPMKQNASAASVVSGNHGLKGR